MAKLTYYYGAMNAGKSLTLLAFAAKLRNKGIPYAVLKPSMDTRDGAFISSRPLQEKLSCYLWNPGDNSWIDGLISSACPLKYILVDEAQFLNEDQVMKLVEIVDNKNVDVVCYGLRTDFQTHLFEGSKRLFELADELHEIEDIDAEGNKVIINARIKDGKVVIAGPQVEVGAEDKYQSMSRKEFYSKIDAPASMWEALKEELRHPKTEEAPAEEKEDYYLEGIAIPFGELNSNGRFYTKESFITRGGVNLFEEFHRRIKESSVFGTIEQNEMYEDISLCDFSHQVVDATMKTDGIYVKLKVLDTPKGKLLKQMLDVGINFFASQRAMGMLEDNKMVDVDDLIGYDVVTRSSFDKRGKELELTKKHKS